MGLGSRVGRGVGVHAGRGGYLLANKVEKRRLRQRKQFRVILVIRDVPKRGGAAPRLVLVLVLVTHARRQHLRAEPIVAVGGRLLGARRERPAQLRRKLPGERARLGHETVKPLAAPRARPRLHRRVARRLQQRNPHRASSLEPAHGAHVRGGLRRARTTTGLGLIVCSAFLVQPRRL